jgi:hypothetical protein
MSAKLTYTVFHDDIEEPVYTTAQKHDAIRWCRANYHRSERSSLVITYHNPHSKAPLQDHAGCLKLPADFKPEGLQ